jgi:hypothetical protein
MKVAGFTFIRNAILYDYPVVEAINSILPLCDKVFVAVGRSEDDTLNLIKSIDNDKIAIIETIWDESLREGGKVLAVETNKAFDAISDEFDWAFYIQGDEIVHEKYLPRIRKSMEQSLDDEKVEGLLFRYMHFYGSYDYIADSPKWYRREVRIIRNNKNIRSYRDAQGFRIDGRKLNVKLINAYIYHYGWVKHPDKQQAKLKSFNKLWHTDQWVNDKTKEFGEFDYSGIGSLQFFTGSHPEVITERIKEKNWKFACDISKKNLSLKARIIRIVERITGYRLFEYRNYKIIN